MLNHTRNIALIAASLTASIALSTAFAQDPPKPAAAPATPPAAAPAAPTAPATPAADLPKGEDLIQAHFGAMGGKDAIAAIKSCRYKAELDMIMDKIQLDVASMAPNLLKLSQSASGTTVETGFDGTIGWTTNPFNGEIQLLDAQMIEGMRDGSDLQALIRGLDKSFGEFNTTGDETFEGAACWAVSMKAKTGDTSTALFNKETKLLQGIRQTQQAPQGTMTATVSLGDWTDESVGEAKIKVFKSLRIEQEGMKISGVFREFEFNKLESAFFAAPDKAKEMAKQAKPAETPATPAAPAAPPAEAPKDAPAEKKN
jgi:hypothetical protein